MTNIRHFFFNPFEERTLLVWDGDLEGVVIDPGCQPGREQEELMDFVRRQGLRIRAILLTHAHPDHIFGLKACMEAFGAPVRMHPADAWFQDHPQALGRSFPFLSPLEKWSFEPVEDGDTVTCGDLVFEVIATPGHTPGSVCYLLRKEKILFSGDTLFAGTIGRTDLPGGDYDTEITSIIERLLPLDGDTEVYPGHGGSTTIGYERTQNPFLQPFNEKDERTGAVDGIEVDG